MGCVWSGKWESSSRGDVVGDISGVVVGLSF